MLFTVRQKEKRKISDRYKKKKHTCTHAHMHISFLTHTLTDYTVGNLHYKIHKHTHTFERGWIEAACLLRTKPYYTIQHNTKHRHTHSYRWARVNWGCRSSHNRRDATAVPRWWCAPHRLQTSHIEESVINDVIF